MLSILNDIKIKAKKIKLNNNNEQNSNTKSKYGTTILTNLEDYKKYDKLGIIKYKPKNFVLANTIDIIYKYSGNYKVDKRLRKEMRDLKHDFEENNFYYEGFQIYGLIDEKLIGVMEGPPNTLYEKGFFLFEIIIDKNYPFGGGSKFFLKLKFFIQMLQMMVYYHYQKILKYFSLL